MDLQLRIPELADTLDPAVEVRGVYVEEWVEALPYADPLRVFRGLFDRLREWNHAPLKASLRLELLELLLPAYLSMFERHTQLHARASTTAFERYRDEADGARQVAQQFAYGYKLALLQSDERRRLLGGNKQIRIAAQRAALMLAYGLLHGYHQYLPGLRHQWPELHELYSFAEQGGIHQQPGVARGVRQETTDSLETIYARIALLSAADPLHLAYGEVWTLFAALAQVESLHIKTPGAAHTPHAADIVLSSQDGPPRRQAHWVNGLPEGARCVDPMPVVLALRQQRSSQHRALQQFADSLEKPARRTSERIDAGGRVRVTAGLASVHHFSGGAQVLQKPERSPVPGNNDGADGQDDTDGTIDIDDFDPEDTLPSQHLYIADSWQLANQSQAGICLTRERRSQNLPMVGELVGLRASAPDEGEQTPSPWAVGIVRWLTIDARKSHRMGIELLSSNARPVRLAGSGQQKPAALALASTNKDQIRIIVPAGTYRPGQPITVDCNGRDISLNPQRMVLSSDSIECIDCVN